MTRQFIIKLLLHNIKKQGGRALNSEGVCVYKTKQNKLCGHSMFVKPEYRNVPMCTNAKELIREHGDQIHHEEFRGFPVGFWFDIQKIHDRDYYWNGLELNELGENKVNKVLNNNYETLVDKLYPANYSNKA